MAKRAAKERVSGAQRPEDQWLGIGPSLAYGFQHVLTMYGGIITVPLIMGTAAGLNGADIGILIASALFIGGLATILQTIGVPFFGSQLPLVQGGAFAGIATMIVIMNGGGGLPAVFGAVIVSSAIGVLLSPFFAALVRFFPPIVTGVVIIAIGLSLLPVTANWAMGGNAEADDYGSLANLALAAFALVVVLVLSKFGTPMIARLSILLSLVISTIVAAIFGLVDFSTVFQGDIFAFPTPFAFGLPTFDIAAIISLLIVVLVLFAEATASVLAVGEIVGTKVDSKRIAAALRTDMLASAVGPVFNAFPLTVFSQNVGLVAITKVKSRYVVAAGGIIMVLLGLLPILGRVVAAIPVPVLGGVGIMLFTSISASGIVTLAKVDYKNNGFNLLIIAASIGFGMLPVFAPTIYSVMPEWFQNIFNSGIASATFMAVLLNLFFNHLLRGMTGGVDNRTPYSPDIARAVPDTVIDALQDGDYFVGGKLLDASGQEIAITPTGTIRLPNSRDKKDAEAAENPPQ